MEEEEEEEEKEEKEEEDDEEDTEKEDAEKEDGRGIVSFWLVSTFTTAMDSYLVNWVRSCLFSLVRVLLFE